MARIVPVEFTARLLASRRSPVFFDVIPGSGIVEVIGGLSTGDDGWHLSAIASRRRSQITLSIIATQEPPTHGQQMEEHSYTARLLDLRPGKYDLTVRHVFRALPGSGYAQELVAFECRVILTDGTGVVAR